MTRYRPSTRTFVCFTVLLASAVSVFVVFPAIVAAMLMISVP